MCNAALAVDDVESVRPAGVGRLDRVLKIIEQGWKIDLEIPYAGMGHGASFLQILGIGNQDFFFHVAVGLPGVRGVSFLDVDHVEGDLLFVLLVEFVQFGNLPTKWRSGVAPENQNHRPLSAK